MIMGGRVRLEPFLKADPPTRSCANCRFCAPQELPTPGLHDTPIAQFCSISGAVERLSPAGRHAASRNSVGAMVEIGSPTTRLRPGADGVRQCADVDPQG